MDLTIHTTFLPHDDPDASLAFWRDTLGFEVRSDVGSGKMRWITVGPAKQPGTSILLGPPAADPGITDDERRTITEMIAKGTYGWIILATADLDGTFERLQASDAEVVQEPTDQPYGVRDCAFRDPAGNLIRIQETGSSSGERDHELHRRVPRGADPRTGVLDVIRGLIAAGPGAHHAGSPTPLRPARPTPLPGHGRAGGAPSTAASPRSPARPPAPRPCRRGQARSARHA